MIDTDGMEGADDPRPDDSQAPVELARAVAKLSSGGMNPRTAERLAAKLAQDMSDQIGAAALELARNDHLQGSGLSRLSLHLLQVARIVSQDR